MGRLDGMQMKNDGYSFMELVVTLTIISILATITIPGFLGLFTRNQINEALPLGEIAKNSVASVWGVTKSFPTDNASAGLPAADKIVNNFISSIAVEDGAIHITFGNSANQVLKGKILTLRPAIVEDAPIVPITWVCGVAAAPGNMTVKGNNKTDVPVSYLPAKCR